MSRFVYFEGFPLKRVEGFSFQDAYPALALRHAAGNGVLFDGRRKLIDDSTLVAITIMIAESKPKEKDAMVALVMNFLAMGS